MADFVCSLKNKQTNKIIFKKGRQRNVKCHLSNFYSGNGIFKAQTAFLITFKQAIAVVLKHIQSKDQARSSYFPFAL